MIWWGPWHRKNLEPNEETEKDQGKPTASSHVDYGWILKTNVEYCKRVDEHPRIRYCRNLWHTPNLHFFIWVWFCQKSNLGYTVLGHSRFGDLGLASMRYIQALSIEILNSYRNSCCSHSIRFGDTVSATMCYIRSMSIEILNLTATVAAVTAFGSETQFQPRCVTFGLCLLSWILTATGSVWYRSVRRHSFRLDRGH